MGTGIKKQIWELVNDLAKKHGLNAKQTEAWKKLCRNSFLYGMNSALNPKKKQS